MATQQKSQLSPRVRRLLSTRRGIITVAAGAAVLGGAILIVFLSAYRDSLTGGGDTEQVLVANVLIEPGSPADAIAGDKMYEITSIENADIEGAAVRNPDAIKGMVTTTPIYPGEQLATTDFRPQNGSLGDEIRGRERAISLPFTSYGGLAGDLKAGDHVDVIGLFSLDPESGASSRPVSKILMQDALVLKVPSSESGVGSSSEHAVVIRGTDEEATELAFTAEYGIPWLALRPAAGAEEMKRPSPIVVDNLVFGLPPIPVREFRQQFRARQ
jgi:Flp pilus assembly protein CpaB